MDKKYYWKCFENKIHLSCTLIFWFYNDRRPKNICSNSASIYDHHAEASTTATGKNEQCNSFFFLQQKAVFTWSPLFQTERLVKTKFQGISCRHWFQEYGRHDFDYSWSNSLNWNNIQNKFRLWPNWRNSIISRACYLFDGQSWPYWLFSKNYLPHNSVKVRNFH